MDYDIVLRVEDISYKYSDERKEFVLENFSFSLKKGEIVAIFGPNGCGKTTLLNLIFGFLKPTSGKIRHRKSEKTSVGFIFQEYSLLDWKTVYQNIELGLISRGIEHREKEIIIKNVLKLLDIEKYRNKFPKQLSGGIKQRTTLGRSLVSSPNLLLIDEPLSAVDIKSKNKLMADLRKIIKEESKSAILVTHNIEEAVFLSDRILTIDPASKKINQNIKINLPKKRGLTLFETPRFQNQKTIFFNKYNLTL